MGLRKQRREAGREGEGEKDREGEKKGEGESGGRERERIFLISMKADYTNKSGVN